MNTRPHIAMISCEQAREDGLEYALRDRLELPFIKGEGCYQGEVEHSYMVVLGTNMRVVRQRLTWLQMLGVYFEQESVLYCDNERTAYLLYCEGPRAPRLGKLVSVASPEGDYSYFNGTYWEIQA